MIIISVAVSLFYKGVLFDPIYSWIKYVVLLSLIIGIIGPEFGLRPLRYLGWIGLILYIRCALQIVFPSEEYISGGPDGPPLFKPRLPSGGEAMFRIVAVSTIIFVLFSIIKMKGKKDINSE